METLNHSNTVSDQNHSGKEAYERARKNVSKASGKIQEGLHEIVGETKNVTRAGVDYASELTDEGIRMSKDYASRATEQITQYVKKKPVQSAFIALGIGMLLGRKFISKKS